MEEEAMDDIEIRIARAEDAAAVQRIYAHYVKNSAVTFDGEDEAPSVEALRAKMLGVLERFPWLVAVRSDDIVGFSYASPFRSRAAYDWTVETTIYLAPEVRARGIGRMLYERLEELLVRQGVQSMCACIAVTDREHDDHLTDASVHFHRAMGYRDIGTFSNCGFKFGQWYGITWMQKDIGPHDGPPCPLVPFSA